MAVACPSLVPMRTGTLPWCRERVAEMAETAARRLPAGIRLGYVEAWRPFRRQQVIWEWLWRSIEEARPELPYAAKRRIVCRWVAPVDQKAPPGHCTGAALDLYLLDASGEPLDVVSPYDRFRSSATYSFGLSPEASTNRMLLVDTLLEAGFSNCRDEFWHYSYGDAGWAVRTGRDECVYGQVELPFPLWEESQKVWEREFRNRPNPFLDSVA